MPTGELRAPNRNRSPHSDLHNCLAARHPPRAPPTLRARSRRDFLRRSRHPARPFPTTTIRRIPARARSHTYLLVCERATRSFGAPRLSSSAAAEILTVNIAQALIAGRRATWTPPRGGGGEARCGGVLKGRGSALWRREGCERGWALRKCEKRARRQSGDGNGVGEGRWAQGWTLGMLEASERAESGRPRHLECFQASKLPSAV